MIRGGADEPVVEQEGDMGDMMATLVVAAQAEEANLVEAHEVSDVEDCAHNEDEDVAGAEDYIKE